MYIKVYTVYTHNIKYGHLQVDVTDCDIVIYTFKYFKVSMRL